MTQLFYNYALTNDLIHQCDGPVKDYIVYARAKELKDSGLHSLLDIRNALNEALDILAANDGYLPSNEF